MKNISILTFLVVLLSACGEDFLNINSETDLTTGNYFKTEADIEQAVNGAYAPLRTIYDNAFMMGEMASDNSHFTLNPDFRATIDQEEIAYHISGPANIIASAKFDNNYLIIARANQILASLDEIELDGAFEDQKRGEALFLRALAYFDLVQYFGEVPLHLEPATSFEATRQPLADVPSVYERIIQDAGDAATFLPAKSAQQEGRATSGAAYTLLGNVYVVLGQWEDAETALRNVVSSNEYDLLPNYADAFDPSNKNSVESVFEVQFLEGTQGFSSNFMYDMITIPLSAAQVEALTGVDNPGNIDNGQQYNTPSPDLINAYDWVNDTRFAANIDSSDNVSGNTFPYVKKYLHPHDLFQNANTNWPVYRYSEVLLLLAEALFEQDNSDAEALALVNQVRARAGSIAPLAALTKDAILNERRLELAFENKRYLDLKRTGRLVDTMTAFGAAIRANPTDYYYPSSDFSIPPSAFTSITTDYEIPVGESSLNPFVD